MFELSDGYDAVSEVFASMLGCDGELRDAEMPQVQDDEVHYRVLAREMNPVALRSVEHTAQWRSTEAAKLQFDFVRGVSMLFHVPQP